MQKIQKKGQTIILILLFVLLIGLAIFFLFKSSNSNSDIEKTNNQIQIIEDNTQIEEQTADSINFEDTPINSETTQQIKEFDMIARQWDFDPETITVNRGDLVKLNIESIDVSHGIAIPDFGVSQRLSPGDEVNIEFTADKSGTFSFFCNVACGAGHSSMDGQLIVE